MPIVGAFIMPHGAIVLEPNKIPEMQSDLLTLHKSLYTIGEEIYKARPDLIILTTPHGISLSETFGIYLNHSAAGTSEWNDEFKDYSMKFEIASDESKFLLHNLKRRKIEVEGIVSYSEDEVAPLRWAEVIPLWFVSIPYKNYTLHPIPFPKCIIISIPRKRLQESPGMVNDLLLFGDEIYKFCLSLEAKVAIITSGDLAHTHVTLPKTIECKFEDEADTFDQAIENWAKNPIENEKDLLLLSEFVKEFLLKAK